MVFEKEEEEEERANPQTRRQLERMHMVFHILMCTLAFPQFQQFDITKSDLDEWYDWCYGPSITRAHTTTFQVHTPLV